MQEDVNNNLFSSFATFKILQGKHRTIHLQCLFWNSLDHSHCTHRMWHLLCGKSLRNWLTPVCALAGSRQSPAGPTNVHGAKHVAQAFSSPQQGPEVGHLTVLLSGPFTNQVPYGPIRVLGAQALSPPLLLDPFGKAGKYELGDHWHTFFLGSDISVCSSIRPVRSSANCFPQNGVSKTELPIHDTTPPPTIPVIDVGTLGTRPGFRTSCPSSPLGGRALSSRERPLSGPHPSPDSSYLLCGLRAGGSASPEAHWWARPAGGRSVRLLGLCSSCTTVQPLRCCPCFLPRPVTGTFLLRNILQP